VKPTQKSNRSIITNAVSHCCLAGHVNKDKVDKALEVHQVITVMILVLVVTPNVAAATLLLSLKFIYVAHHITAVTLPHVGCENRAWGHKRYYQTCFSFGVYLFDRTFALLVPFALVMVG